MKQWKSLSNGCHELSIPSHGITFRLQQEKFGYLFLIYAGDNLVYDEKLSERIEADGAIDLWLRRLDREVNAALL